MFSSVLASLLAGLCKGLLLVDYYQPIFTKFGQEDRLQNKPLDFGGNLDYCMLVLGLG